jgi:Tol biopolymer transport system component
MPVSGGSPSVICDVDSGVLGTTWLADGTMVFGNLRSGLSRVSVEGGKPETITSLNRDREERTHSYPEFLPDGRHFLFTADSDKAEERAVYLSSLDSKEVVRILNVRHKVNYIQPGYLLFIRGVSLMAQRFQFNPPKLTGEAFSVAEGVSVNSSVNSAPFMASTNGTILYRGGDVPSKTQLAWFDRHGKALGTVGPVQSDISVKLSPDGTRAAVSSAVGSSFRSATGEPAVNIWVLDLARGVRSRVTFDPAISDENPTWSPDGRFIAFGSHRTNDRADIYEKSFSGEGQEKPLLLGGTINQHPIDWSPDGKTLLLHGNGNQQLDLFTLSLSEKDAKPIPFVASSGADAQGQFSPDGRWVAYVSTESGSNEVYVKPFPSGDGKWQISSAGGSQPRWRGDGKEIFYLSLDGTLMSVSLKMDPVFEPTQPVALFKPGVVPIGTGEWGGAAQYDVTKDGSRFLINTEIVPATPPNLYVIVNWKPETK